MRLAAECRTVRHYGCDFFNSHLELLAARFRREMAIRQSQRVREIHPVKIRNVHQVRQNVDQHLVVRPVGIIHRQFPKEVFDLVFVFHGSIDNACRDRPRQAYFSHFQNGFQKNRRGVIRFSIFRIHFCARYSPHQASRKSVEEKERDRRPRT